MQNSKKSLKNTKVTSDQDKINEFVKLLKIQSTKQRTKDTQMQIKINVDKITLKTLQLRLKQQTYGRIET